MRRLVVTGAGGFIGAALARQSLEAGWDVTSLARRPPPHGAWMEWSLGRPLPDACEGAAAVVHLASATLTAKSRIDEAVDLDILGARSLVEGIRSWPNPPRFIFLSSQSARAEAQNQYGRSKFAIEGMLDRPDEIIVRPGLVYDDAGSSVFGLFEKLSRLPVVPSISSRPNIQPIHVRELADCILRIADAARPDKAYCLGAPEPMTMGQAIVATAQRSGRRPPLVVLAPVGPVRVLAGAVDKLFGVSPPITERIDGLTALRPMDTAASLRSLQFALEPF